MHNAYVYDPRFHNEISADLTSKKKNPSTSPHLAFSQNSVIV